MEPSIYDNYWFVLYITHPWLERLRKTSCFLPLALAPSSSSLSRRSRCSFLLFRRIRWRWQGWAQTQAICLCHCILGHCFFAVFFLSTFPLISLGHCFFAIFFLGMFPLGLPDTVIVSEGDIVCSRGAVPPADRNAINAGMITVLPESHSTYSKSRWGIKPPPIRCLWGPLVPPRLPSTPPPGRWGGPPPPPLVISFSSVIGIFHVSYRILSY